MNSLESRLKEFIESPLSPLSLSSREQSPLFKARSSSTDSDLNQSFGTTSELSRNVYNDNTYISTTSFSDLSLEQSTPIKKLNVLNNFKPSMIPASVYRKSAKNDCM